MNVHRIMAIALCTAALACGSQDITGVENADTPDVQPSFAVLYGYVTVGASTVRLQGVNSPSAILTGPLVDELRGLDGAFVIVRGEFAGAALDLPMLTVESYDVIKAATP